METVAALIAKGTDVNAGSGDDATPMHLAALEGRSDVVGLLAAAGADVNAKDNDNDRPIHNAARRGHADTVAPLVAQGRPPPTPRSRVF